MTATPSHSLPDRSGYANAERLLPSCEDLGEVLGERLEAGRLLLRDPRDRVGGALSGLRTRARTCWPWLDSSRTSSVPMLPGAPATEIMALSLPGNPSWQEASAKSRNYRPTRSLPRLLPDSLRDS